MRACACGKSLEGTYRGRKWCPDRCRRHTLYSGKCVDCGAATYNGSQLPPARCVPCGNIVRGAQERRERWDRLEPLWASGATIREIARVMGWTVGSAGAEVSRARAAGADLPRRHKISEAGLAKIRQTSTRTQLARHAKARA